MATTEEIINCIRYGLDSTWIMTQADTSPSKLRRALESPQMIHRLRTEELLGRMQMRLRAVRHLPHAIDGLVRLIDAAEPEAARKACLVVIAAATGINLANPAVPVYPEEAVDAAQLVDHPEDKARRQEADQRDRAETEHAAYVESLKDLIARWEHHPPAEAPKGDVLAQVEAAVKDKMDRTYRDENAEGELPGPRVPNPAYASDQEMRDYPWENRNPPAEAAAGPTGDDEAESNDPDDDGPDGNGGGGSEGDDGDDDDRVDDDAPDGNGAVRLAIAGTATPGDRSDVRSLRGRPSGMTMPPRAEKVELRQRRLFHPTARPSLRRPIAPRGSGGFASPEPTPAFRRGLLTKARRTVTGHTERCSNPAQSVKIRPIPAGRARRETRKISRIRHLRTGTPLAPPPRGVPRPAGPDEGAGRSDRVGWDERREANGGTAQTTLVPPYGLRWRPRKGGSPAPPARTRARAAATA